MTFLSCNMFFQHSWQEISILLKCAILSVLVLKCTLYTSYGLYLEKAKAILLWPVSSHFCNICNASGVISRLFRRFLTIAYVDHVFDLLQGWRLYNLTRWTNWWAREQYISKVFLIVITFKGFVDVVYYNKPGILLIFFFCYGFFYQKEKV